MRLSLHGVQVEAISAVRNGYRILSINGRCQRLLANGEKCGRAVGHCIHDFKATKFGKQV